MVTVTDDELATAAAEGEAGAFPQIYERYGEPIYDYLARLTGSRDEAADLTQATFERAWRALSGGRTPDHPRPWLYSIAHNVAIDALRRRRPLVALEDEDFIRLEPAPATLDPEAVALAAETAEDVWASAAALNPSEYTVLHCQLRAGLAPAEIAEVLHLRPGAVHVALSRARHSLEDAFTAMQVVRRGLRDCPDLSDLLGGHPPTRMDKATLRLVKGHMDGCERCRENARRFVAPAELFAALIPLAPTELRAPPATVLPGHHTGLVKGSGRLVRHLARASGSVPAAASAAVLATWLFIGGSDAGPFAGPVAVDPANVHSVDHLLTEPSADPRIEMTWDAPHVTGAQTVLGYSVSWTHRPRSEPPAVIGLLPSATGTVSPALGPGRWWFHLRTEDRAHRWTDTVHVGPFAISGPDAATTPAAGGDEAGSVEAHAAGPPTDSAGESSPSVTGTTLGGPGAGSFPSGPPITLPAPVTAAAGGGQGPPSGSTAPPSTSTPTTPSSTTSSTTTSIPQSPTTSTTLEGPPVCCPLPPPPTSTTTTTRPTTTTTTRPPTTTTTEDDHHPGRDGD